MRKIALLACLAALFVAGCASLKRGGEPCVSEDSLKRLDAELDEAEKMWMEAIDDPWTEPELRLRYEKMQDVCRECSRRRGGFATVEQKELCDRVRFPFAIYFNELRVRANNLNEQIFEIGKPGTVACDYATRPSKANAEKLRNVFDQVHRYFVGWPYTWSRYINKYKFQKSRLDNFRREFRNRTKEYRDLAAQPAADFHALTLARRRAEFAFDRLKREYVTNDLPPAGEVNAFYLAKSLDDYFRLEEEEKKTAGRRAAEGRRKEVVVFVHGLSEKRTSWGRFPEFLAREDEANEALGDIYFKVYVFSYDTVEDSKSVEGFKRELAGFISDIVRDEKVKRVHLVGHSFGAVLCLTYMIHQADDILKGVDLGNAGAVAKALVGAYEKGVVPLPVKSFTSIAGSLSGSQTANIAGEQFIPREQLFRKRLPLFRTGVPGYGDIQVRENQIGSEVNLRSFWRLDTECPLFPEGLLKFLPAGERPRGEALLALLRREKIPVLCIIGDPCKLQCLLTKQGLLKMREAGKILSAEGLATVLGSFGRLEDDGLVKSYSANINHAYLLASGEDIGYRDASVRYAAYGHYSLCKVLSREHHSYRYTVSFLNGHLLPQMESGSYTIRYFAVLMRVFPAGIDPLKTPEAHMLPGRERIIYLPDRKLTLPPLEVEPFPCGGSARVRCSRNVSLGGVKINRLTGVIFWEGRIFDIREPSWVAYRIGAGGYRDKVITVPVRPGEVSYAVNVSLEKEEGTHK